MKTFAITLEKTRKNIGVLTERIEKLSALDHLNPFQKWDYEETKKLLDEQVKLESVFEENNTTMLFKHEGKYYLPVVAM